MDTNTKTARKLKCDGGRPSCSQCVKRAQNCEYKTQVRRRGAGAQVQQRQMTENNNTGNVSAATPTSATTNTNANTNAGNASARKDAVRDSNDSNSMDSGPTPSRNVAGSTNSRGNEENGPSSGNPPPSSSAAGHTSGPGFVGAPMGSLQLRPRSTGSDHAQHASLPPPPPSSSSSATTQSSAETKRGLGGVLPLQTMPIQPMTRRLAAEERALREGPRLRERGGDGGANVNGHQTPASSRQERLAHGHVSAANASAVTGPSAISLSVTPSYPERSQLAPMPFSTVTSPTAPSASSINSSNNNGNSGGAGVGVAGSSSPGPHAHAAMSGSSSVNAGMASAPTAAAGTGTDESESASVNAQTRRPRPSQNRTGRVSNYGPKVVACNFCRGMSFFALFSFVVCLKDSLFLLFFV